RLDNATGNVFGGTLHRRIERGSGGEGEAKNAAAMVVFDHGVKGRLAMARAHCKEGEFPGERHEALQDEMELGKLGFSFHNVVCGAQDPLPLAVIAHPASLEHGRSEEHKSELQSPAYLVYLLLLDQKHI